jgi:hypothetical protein
MSGPYTPSATAKKHTRRIDRLGHQSSSLAGGLEMHNTASTGLKTHAILAERGEIQ